MKFKFHKYELVLIPIFIVYCFYHYDLLKKDRREVLVIFENSGFYNGMNFVDLGLPSGNLWSVYNYKSTSSHRMPFQKKDSLGVYYGDSKTSYGLNGTIDCPYYLCGMRLPIEELCDSVQLEDTKSELAIDLDSGNVWHVPTEDDVRELIENCEWHWVDAQFIGVAGISKINTKYIFFPAAGSKRIDLQSKRDNSVGIVSDDYERFCRYPTSVITASGMMLCFTSTVDGQPKLDSVLTSVALPVRFVFNPKDIKTE